MAGEVANDVRLDLNGSSTQSNAAPTLQIWDATMIVDKIGAQSLLASTPATEGASDAPLKQGDVILAVNGQPVSSMDALIFAVQNNKDLAFTVVTLPSDDVLTEE